MQRRNHKNDRRERSCSAGIIKSVIGNILAAQKLQKQPSGTFLQRRTHKNSRRGHSCSAGITETVVGNVLAAQETPKWSSDIFTT